MTVPYIPSGFHTITPYLVIDDVQGQIDFLLRAFGGVEIERTADAKGRIMHAEVRIGDSILMLGGAMEGQAAVAGMFYLYVPHVDEMYEAGIAAGGTSISEPMDHFYGDRCGGFRDPFGNTWWIATHIEDVPPDELARRAASR
jgi:PhnB protein